MVIGNNSNNSTATNINTREHRKITKSDGEKKKRKFSMRDFH